MPKLKMFDYSSKTAKKRFVQLIHAGDDNNGVK